MSSDASPAAEAGDAGATGAAAAAASADAGAGAGAGRPAPKGGGIDLIRRDSERRKAKRASAGKGAAGASGRVNAQTMAAALSSRAVAGASPKSPAKSPASSQASAASGAASPGGAADGSAAAGNSSVTKTAGYNTLTRKEKAATLLKGTQRLDDMAFSLFEEFDKQRKGWLTRDELQAEMQAMDFSPAEVAQIWSKIGGADGSGGQGKVTYPMFSAGFAHLLRGPNAIANAAAATAALSAATAGGIGPNGTLPKPPGTPAKDGGDITPASFVSPPGSNRGTATSGTFATFVSPPGSNPRGNTMDRARAKELFAAASAASASASASAAAAAGAAAPDSNTGSGSGTLPRGISPSALVAPASPLPRAGGGGSTPASPQMAGIRTGSSPPPLLPAASSAAGSGMDDATTEKLLRRIPQAQQQMDNAKMAMDLFQVLDEDGNGELTREELLNTMLDLDPTFTQEQLYGAYDQLDVGKKGYITMQEFCDGFSLFSRQQSHRRTFSDDLDEKAAAAVAAKHAAGLAASASTLRSGQTPEEMDAALRAKQEAIQGLERALQLSRASQAKAAKSLAIVQNEHALIDTENSKLKDHGAELERELKRRKQELDEQTESLNAQRQLLADMQEERKRFEDELARSKRVEREREELLQQERERLAAAEEKLTELQNNLTALKSSQVSQTRQARKLKMSTAAMASSRLKAMEQKLAEMSLLEERYAALQSDITTRSKEEDENQRLIRDLKGQIGILKQTLLTIDPTALASLGGVATDISVPPTPTAAIGAGISGGGSGSVPATPSSAGGLAHSGHAHPVHSHGVTTRVGSFMFGSAQTPQPATNIHPALAKAGSAAATPGSQAALAAAVTAANAANAPGTGLALGSGTVTPHAPHPLGTLPAAASLLDLLSESENNTPAATPRAPARTMSATPSGGAQSSLSASATTPLSAPAGVSAATAAVAASPSVVARAASSSSGAGAAAAAIAIAAKYASGASSSSSSSSGSNAVAGSSSNSVVVGSAPKPDVSGSGRVLRPAGGGDSSRLTATASSLNASGSSPPQVFSSLNAGSGGGASDTPSPLTSPQVSTSTLASRHANSNSNSSSKPVLVVDGSEHADIAVTEGGGGPPPGASRMTGKRGSVDSLIGQGSLSVAPDVANASASAAATGGGGSGSVPDTPVSTVGSLPVASPLPPSGLRPGIGTGVTKEPLLPPKLKGLGSAGASPAAPGESSSDSSPAARATASASAAALLLDGKESVAKYLDAAAAAAKRDRVKSKLAGQKYSTMNAADRAQLRSAFEGEMLSIGAALMQESIAQQAEAALKASSGQAQLTDAQRDRIARDAAEHTTHVMSGSLKRTGAGPLATPAAPTAGPAARDGAAGAAGALGTGAAASPSAAAPLAGGTDLSRLLAALQQQLRDADAARRREAEDAARRLARANAHNEQLSKRLSDEAKERARLQEEQKWLERQLKLLEDKNKQNCVIL